MKRFWRHSLQGAAIVAVILSCKNVFASDGSAFSYAPKLGVRFNSGLMQNAGSLKTSSVAMWGVNLVGLYYPISTLAVGGGYCSIFDLSKGITPVTGFFAVGRWYFWGQGTRSTADAGQMTMERHESYAFYVGPEFAKSDYYLGTNGSEVADSLTGSFLNINAVAGVDISLSRHFEANIEGSIGLLTLAASDERFRIKGMVINAGISFLW